MKYTKPALTIDQQADQLISRGLVISSRDALVAKLSAVSYYRLSAYWYRFKQADEQFQTGTTFEVIWRNYTFDRQLRLLVLDVIERVEIAIRTRLTNLHTVKYGPFGYLDRATLPGISVVVHSELLESIRKEARRSSEWFVKHYFEKYSSETDLPLWMASELVPFGAIFTFFRYADVDIRKAIAEEYGVAEEVLKSWMGAINQVRNLCAHHARLWNRILGMKPQIPRENKHPEWHKPVLINSEKLFGILTVLYFMLRKVAPQSRWRDRLESLFGKYPDIPLIAMGFPENWKESPIWSFKTGASIS